MHKPNRNRKPRTTAPELKIRRVPYRVDGEILGYEHKVLGKCLGFSSKVGRGWSVRFFTDTLAEAEARLAAGLKIKVSPK